MMFNITCMIIPSMAFRCCVDRYVPFAACTLVSNGVWVLISLSVVWLMQHIRATVNNDLGVVQIYYCQH